MADCCFPAERRSVDGGTTSQIARLHVVSLRPGKGAADRRRSSSSFPAASSGSDRTSASSVLLAVTLQARTRFRLSFPLAERLSHPVDLDRSRDSSFGSSDVADAPRRWPLAALAIGWEAFDIRGGGA